MLTRLRLCSAAILLAPSAGLRLFAPSAGLRLRGFARPLATAAPSMSMADAALPTLEDLTDPREWLEEVEGDKQIGWVKEQNADAVARIGEPSDKPLYGRLLEIMESDEKIPYIGRVLNGLYYNFWQDETHVQGIWRRCTLDEYRKAEPEWELVLDLDALSAESGTAACVWVGAPAGAAPEASPTLPVGVSWVWGGSTLLDEGPGVRKDRVMVSLSRGGADAKVSREFDLDAKEFVAVMDGGFELPEAKSQLSYKDRDTLLVGGVFGDAREGGPAAVRRGCPSRAGVCGQARGR